MRVTCVSPPREFAEKCHASISKLRNLTSPYDVCSKSNGKITPLQENLQRENTEATEGDVNSTLEMQNLMRVLHEHRAQLAEKTKQIDSYKQVDGFRHLYS